jgi:hypothetical protein
MMCRPADLLLLDICGICLLLAIRLASQPHLMHAPICMNLLYMQAGSRRPDLRVYDAVLDALLENSSRIGQLVVVTPLGGGGGTGFFGGGGRGGGGSSRLSALEQRVVDSGVSYLLVRAAPSDRVTDRYGEEANVVVEGLGGLPSGLQASRSQVGCGGLAGCVECGMQRRAAFS